MSKVLLKQAGTNPSKKYQDIVAKMIRVTIIVEASMESNLKMISARKLHINDGDNSNDDTKRTS